MHALLGTLVAVLLAVGVASAADEKTARPPQVQRMSECNAQAREKALAGDARKQFMSDCLKGHAATDGGEAQKPAAGASHDKASHGRTAQGEKMKSCNQEATAKNLKGDDRKDFMSHCLKAERP